MFHNESLVMGVKRKKSGDIFFKIGSGVARLRLKFLEGLYSSHLRVRYLHDKTYAKGGSYKNWSDKSYSAAVHRAVLVGFVISFLIFSVINIRFK